jgi:DNA (cytosine-5)-methyltransferase 1
VKALELFAGAGGAALGLRAAGIEALACVELDESACATLKAAGFPAVQADLREWSWDGEKPDLLWSSFPCQIWSMAGKREGAKDTERNGWPWTLRLIDETQPEWVILENVKGLTTHTEAECGNPAGCAGCYLQSAILAELAKRYAVVQHVVLNAADYGVPQHRRRLIVVAGPRAIRWPEPTHTAPGRTLGLFGEALRWVTIGQALGLARVMGGGSNPREKNAEDARTLRDVTDEPSTTISASEWSHNGNQGPFAYDGPCVAIACTDGSGLGGSAGRSALRRMTGLKRLTVEQCSRLQDFPADHPWQGNLSDRYRMVGNAVPPKLAQVVAESVLRETL